MAEFKRLPTKPLNPVACAAHTEDYGLAVGGTAVASLATLGTAIGLTVSDPNAWFLNIAMLCVSVFLGAVVATLLLIRAKYTVKVGYASGVLGALQKVNPAMQYKALPLYDAALKIMESDYICGGNDVMRRKVDERVSKIRELSTANEAARVHEIGDHDLHGAASLIENLARPALESAQTARNEETRRAQEKKNAEEAAARHNAKVAEADNAQVTAAPDAYFPKGSRVYLKNQPEPEPEFKGKGKVRPRT